MKYMTWKQLMNATETAKKNGRTHIDEELIAGLPTSLRFPIYHQIPQEAKWMRINVGVATSPQPTLEEFHSLWLDLERVFYDGLADVEAGDPANVEVRAEEKSVTASDNQQSYQVTMKAEVVVDVEVEAKSVEEARGKAAGWNAGFASGDCKVGTYYVGDIDYYDANDEMFWEIQEVEPLDFVEVTVLEPEDSDVLANGAK